MLCFYSQSVGSIVDVGRLADGRSGASAGFRIGAGETLPARAASLLFEGRRTAASAPLEGLRIAVASAASESPSADFRGGVGDGFVGAGSGFFVTPATAGGPPVSRKEGRGGGNAAPTDVLVLVMPPAPSSVVEELAGLLLGSLARGDTDPERAGGTAGSARGALRAAVIEARGPRASTDALGAAVLGAVSATGALAEGGDGAGDVDSSKLRGDA